MYQRQGEMQKQKFDEEKQALSAKSHN